MKAHFCILHFYAERDYLNKNAIICIFQDIIHITRLGPVKILAGINLLEKLQSFQTSVVLLHP